ncbi:hypothetical protein [Lonsdalea britannica]|nr:hypothetical protein [Lonsdalea britannica]
MQLVADILLQSWQTVAVNTVERDRVAEQDIVAVAAQQRIVPPVRD